MIQVAAYTSECAKIQSPFPEFRAHGSHIRASQVAVMIKNPPANAGDPRDKGSIPGSGRSPGEDIETHTSISAWRICWTEDHGGLQSNGCKELDTTEVT